MSENAIDNGEYKQGGARSGEAKTRAEAGEEGQADEEGGSGKEGGSQTGSRSRQQEGRGHRHDGASQGRDPSGDPDGRWLAGAHRAGLRYHSRAARERRGSGHPRTLLAIETTKSENNTGYSSSKRGLGHVPRTANAEPICSFDGTSSKPFLSPRVCS
jgi:hypothetical protein